MLQQLDNVRRTMDSDSCVSRISNGKSIIDRQLSSIWSPIRDYLLELPERETVESFIARGGKIDK